jgi:hypothetical protein
MAEKGIKASLKSLDILLNRIKDLASGILKGAEKCFAIFLLVGQGQDITSFFKSDSLLQSNPDDCLPYTLEALQQLLGQKKSSLR